MTTQRTTQHPSQHNLYPECGATVVHPEYGKGVVVLIDTGYQSGRGWVHCNTGNSGGFGCYADEVVIVNTAEQRTNENGNRP